MITMSVMGGWPKNMPDVLLREQAMLSSVSFLAIPKRVYPSPNDTDASSLVSALLADQRVSPARKRCR